MKKLLVTFGILIQLVSCTTVKKYNEQIAKQHTPEALRKDIDDLYKQLKKHHPRLYQYTSKANLEFKFDSLKYAIKTPMDSRSFFKRLAPVVTNVRQGHITVGSATKQFKRKERKELLKKKFEFYNLDFEYLEDKLLVKANRGKDSTLVGSEVLSINEEPVQDLIQVFKKRFTSDGYNTTLYNRLISKGFTTFYYKDKGFLDSLQMTFKKKDSVFSKTLRRISKENKKAQVKKDSLKKEKPKKLTGQEKKDRRLAKRKKKRDNKKYGYVAKRKHYTRNLSFIGNDSTVAYMKIRGFSNGAYKKFYKETFTKLDTLKTPYLVIDLRDNLGGRIAEVDKLYSYLTDQPYVFMDSVEVNTRFPYLNSLLSNGNPLWVKTLGAVSMFDPLSMTFQYLKTKKVNDKIYFKMKYNKLRDPNPLNFKGKIYVLINGNSFSASSLISSHLRATNRATFVGEETGGAYNGCVAGIYKIYQLPESKLKVRIGMMQIEAPYNQSPDGYGIKPHVEVLPTIQNRQNNEDPELNWVLKDLGKL